MDIREREEFDLGLELANSNQPQAAHFIFSRLREKYPQNDRVMVLSALTSPMPIETRTVFEAAMRLDPSDPVLSQAIEWLEKRPAGPPLMRPTPLPVASVTGAVRPPGAAAGRVEPVVIPPAKRAAPPRPLDLSGEFAPRIEDARKRPVAPEAAASAVAETVKPLRKGTKKKTKPPKSYLVPFYTVWWVRLACSLLFFGSALGLACIFVTAKNLDETEKAYALAVGQLTQKTGEVNARLQTAIPDFNAGKLDRAGLEKQLQNVIALNDELKQLKSPSTRFDKLDGRLGDAYRYFNDGATALIDGLESGNPDQFDEGYRLFSLGNDSLRQARSELKALGG